MGGSAHVALIVKGIRENGVRASLLIPYSEMGHKLKNTKIKGHFSGVPFCYMNNTTGHSNNKVKAFFQIYQGMVNTGIYLFKRYLKGKRDVVIIGTPNLIKFFPVILVCYIFRIPFYIWAVEKMSFLYKDRGGANRIDYFGFKWAEIILPKIAKGFIVISTALKKYYEDSNKKIKIMLSPILISNKNSNSISKQTENIKEEQQIAINLVEITENSGVFTGKFILMKKTDEGVSGIGVNINDTIIAVYYDQKTADGPPCDVVTSANVTEVKI